MDELFQIIAAFLTATLWGGLVAVDLVVTPARFNTPNIDRQANNAIGAQIFSLWGWVQLWLGVLLVIITIIGGMGLNIILPALFLVVLTALQVFFLEPSMQNLRKPSLSPDEIAANEPLRRQLHQAYLLGDGFKGILVGLVLIVLMNL